MDDGTSVIMGFVHGLGPNPLHGFHIHEFGNLSDDDCASCGDSFYDLGKAMKSSPLLGPFCSSEFWGFSLLKI